jgi:hypothetical protein
METHYFHNSWAALRGTSLFAENAGLPDCDHLIPKH